MVWPIAIPNNVSTVRRCLHIRRAGHVHDHFGCAATVYVLGPEITVNFFSSFLVIVSVFI